MTETGKDYKIDVLMKKVKNKEAIAASLSPILNQIKNIARNHVETKEPVDNIIAKYTDDIIPSAIKKIINTFFSEEELDACIEFFSTKAGEKLLNPEYQKKNQSTLIDISKEMQKEIFNIIGPYLPKDAKEPVSNKPVSNEL